MTYLLDTAAILRVLRTLLAAELARGGRREIGPAETSLWTSDQRTDEEGLGLDSLERIACGTAVNVFFRIHETGIEDYLMFEQTLGGWARVVRAALSEGTSGITVHTSGSTGSPRACFHPWPRLMAETDYWASTFRGRRRIVQLVPSHHLYGFLFTVLLPGRLGAPVLDARASGPGQLARSLTAGDLLVGVPSLLGPLARIRSAVPEGVAIVSAGAALPDDLALALSDAGAESVHDIYGSSETGGVAVRTYPEDTHTLLPFWRPADGGGECGAGIVWADADNVSQDPPDHVTVLPDRISWVSPGRLRLDGRRDHAVQVGGINVYPNQVAERLSAHPMVASCAVRLDEQLNEPRLKALVVPRRGSGDDVVATLEAYCRESFSAAERPVRIDLASHLPRSPLGKTADWQPAA